jgi:hypothetical protein
LDWERAARTVNVNAWPNHITVQSSGCFCGAQSLGSLGYGETELDRADEPITGWYPAMMATPPRKRPLSLRAREALDLIASNPQGVTEAFMHAQGFSLKTVIGLVRSQLATLRRESVKSHGRTIEVVRLQITVAGREALAQ